MSQVTHLNALRALEAAVRTGSFKAAAAELGVTPAAVGQQVRALESYLGRQLLVRRPNGFAPTPAAREAAQKLTSGFETLREAQTLLSRRGRDRQLSLTVAPSFAQMWLAPRLEGFLAAYTDVDLRIDTTPEVVDIESGEFDLAIRYHEPTEGRAQSSVLFAEYLLPVCAPDVAERLDGRDASTLSASGALIWVDRETADAEWLDWDGWAARFGLEVEPRVHGIRFARWPAAMSHAFGGGGLLLAGLAMTLDYIRDGRLVAPFGAAKAARTGYTYQLVCHGDRVKPHVQAAFESWIADEAYKTRASIDAYLKDCG